MGGAGSKAPRAFTKAPRQFAEQSPQTRPKPMTEINSPAASGSKPVEPPHVQAQQSMAAEPQSGPTQLPDLPPELQTAEYRRDAELGSLLDKLSGSIGRRQRVAARDQGSHGAVMAARQHRDDTGRMSTQSLRALFEDVHLMERRAAGVDVPKLAAKYSVDTALLRVVLRYNRAPTIKQRSDGALIGEWSASESKTPESDDRA